jgi:hypothetical protein
MIPDAEAEKGVKLSEEDTGGIDPRVTSLFRPLAPTLFHVHVPVRVFRKQHGALG